ARSRRGALEAGRERHLLGQGPFNCVLDPDITAGCAGNRTLDQDQASLDIGRDHLQVLRGDPLVAEMAGHLLALEDATRILAVTGRTMAAMRNGDPVAGA